MANTFPKRRIVSALRKPRRSNQFGRGFKDQFSLFDVTDIWPPEFSNFSPMDGYTQAALTSDISFDVIDYVSGVDANSIDVFLDGYVIVSNGSPESGYNVVMTPISFGYNILITGAALAGSTEYRVDGYASDLVGNQGTANWSFITTTAPIIKPFDYMEEFGIDSSWDVEVSNQQGALILAGDTLVVNPGTPTNYWAFHTDDIYGSSPVMCTDRGSGGVDLDLIGSYTLAGTYASSPDQAFEINNTSGAGARGTGFTAGRFNNQSWTIAGMYRRTGTVTGNQLIVGNRDPLQNNSKGFYIGAKYLNGNPVITFGIADGTNQIWWQAPLKHPGISTTALGTPNTNETLWHFNLPVSFALTWDNSTGEAKLYTDSWLDKAPTLQNDIILGSLAGADLDNGTSYPLMIGNGWTGSAPGSTYALDGAVDDIAIWEDKVLTQGEIAYYLNVVNGKQELFV